MFKLVTGSPGDGKTSNELWDFLHDDQYKNRPKFCTPINGFNAAEHGVTEIEHIKGWQELPEGAAIFCDEVQDYCGTDLGKEPPEWVKQLARHRHQGKDFICTTQSPMFLHPFARKLAKPHVHYIRPWNMKGARYTWDTVQNDPTTRTAKNLGQRVMVTPNPKVFTLYQSTVLDTHKAKPPYKLFAILGLALALVLAGAFYVYKQVRHYSSPPPDPVVLQAESVKIAAAQPVIDQPESGQPVKPIWTEQSMKPRIPGSLYTAPVYDSLTAPTDFPRVAACMSSESRGTCNCYTQQGTPIEVPQSACLIFVKNGAFDPWFSGRNQQLQASNESPIQTQAPHENVASIDPGRAHQPFTVVEDHSRIQRSKSSADTAR